MDRVIKIEVNGSYIRKDNGVAGVRGEGNSTTLHIVFDETWRGQAKKVTFWNAKGLNPVKRLLSADNLTDMAESLDEYDINIPVEPLEFAGEMELVIDGYTDEMRRRSVRCTLEVLDAPMADDAGEGTDATPSLVEQLQKEIEQILPDVQEELKKSIRIDKTTASAESLSSDKEAEAALKSDEEGNVNFHFGIPRGIDGKDGKDGKDGATIPLGNGVFGMKINDAGHLIIVHNDGATAPDMYIDENGHLIYGID